MKINGVYLNGKRLGAMRRMLRWDRGESVEAYDQVESGRDAHYDDALEIVTAVLLAHKRSQRKGHA